MFYIIHYALMFHIKTVTNKAGKLFFVTNFPARIFLLVTTEFIPNIMPIKLH